MLLRNCPHDAGGGLAIEVFGAVYVIREMRSGDVIQHFREYG